MSANKVYTWRQHSRLFLACGIVILSPFQYGFDFGMIGGLQAMVGFLQVLIRCQSIWKLVQNSLDADFILEIGFWFPN